MTVRLERHLLALKYLGVALLVVALFLAGVTVVIGTALYLFGAFGVLGLLAGALLGLLYLLCYAVAAL